VSLQVLGVLTIELVSNGIVNKCWTLPAGDAAEQGGEEACQNGYANGTHHVSDPKKQQ
jgi:hypothetical protein